MRRKGERSERVGTGRGEGEEIVRKRVEREKDGTTQISIKPSKHHSLQHRHTQNTASPGKSLFQYIRIAGYRGQ